MNHGGNQPARYKYGGYCGAKEPKRAVYYASTPEVILETGLKISDPLARGLYFLSYLGGGRISETTKFCLAQMQKAAGGDEILINLPVLKKRSSYRSALGRTFPIPLKQYALCHENEMWDAFWAVVKDWPDNERRFDLWKRHMKLRNGEVREYSNMSKYLARKLDIRCEVVRKSARGEWERAVITKPCHPHFLRHCRASHLADYYDMNQFQVANWFQWDNPNMASIYVKVKEMRDIIHGKAMAQNITKRFAEIQQENERLRKNLAIFRP